MAVADSQAFNLATEDDAWDFLDRFTKGLVEVTDVAQVTFGDWANISVYIPGKRYNSAITPYMMQGWVELQRSLYRAYALAASGKADAKRLTERDKEILELVVKVDEGSSDQKVDLQAILEKVASSMVDKMTPTHITAVIVALGLLYAGTTATTTWLNNQKEIKLAEIAQQVETTRSEERRESLNAIVSLAGRDLERLQILEEVAKEVPIVAEIEEQASAGRDELVRHVTKTDAVVNGVPISSAAGQSVTSAVRTQAVEERLDGVYTIRGTDTTAATGFRVLLSDKQGREFTAEVADVLTTVDDRNAIQNAEWSKVPLFLTMNAKLRRGEVVEAKIMSARPYDPETDG
ncbi:hypothetical protein [Falsirhodobacter xinxiangensis]|uniref:hypothetical protein n=1 Tax=Falsirhodobacter xinxiangensis TaxID=2530049 RepID=UPI001FE3D017|nr:hypothetical protein [Rhodobacter xinxiangensis]